MSPKQLPFTCWMDIHTNITTHRIPVQAMDGALVLSSMDAVNESHQTLK
jgi:hypothetical protein